MIFSISFACECSEFVSIEDEFHGTEFIIHGQVIKIRNVSLVETLNPTLIDSVRGSFDDEQNRAALLQAKIIEEVELEVCYIYKGKIEEEHITIYTYRSGASCGYIHFEEDKEFIVYASDNYSGFWFGQLDGIKGKKRKENTYWTNQCTRTDEFSIGENSALEKLIEKEKH